MNIPDSVGLGPDPFDFDPEIMKPLFDEARELGRNPSSWVAAPAPGQNASPWLINCYLNCGVSAKQPRGCE